MNSSQLQEKIIHDIRNIDDDNFLEAVYSIIRSRKEANPYKLTPAQKESIKISREQFKTGDFKHHSEVLQEVRGWLNEQ